MIEPLIYDIIQPIIQTHHSSDWILATGFWNDGGEWVDTANWID